MRRLMLTVFLFMAGSGMLLAGVLSSSASAATVAPARYCLKYSTVKPVAPVPTMTVKPTATPTMKATTTPTMAPTTAPPTTMAPTTMAPTTAPPTTMAPTAPGVVAPGATKPATASAVYRYCVLYAATPAVTPTTPVMPVGPVGTGGGGSLGGGTNAALLAAGSLTLLAGAGLGALAYRRRGEHLS